MTLTRQQLRQLVRKRRQALTPEQQQQAAERLLEQLRQHPVINSADKLAIYLANDSEINTLPFIHWCWQQGKAVYLPVLHPFSKGQLLFLHYDQDTAMTVNHLGITEPKLDLQKICPVEQLDVLLTPLVAFDLSGDRLGMGGGFYDRTLEKWHRRHRSGESTKLHPIGLAHDCQRVEKIPSEYWDVPIPEIITPGKVYQCE
ncbi:5-formyltetrahydrofolate cyclo-ligase [Thalassomonas sp. RHCl1]|uniref:5-formyltetrahydrofolate cyclo-ligase n=1 Tax=Thalassomonas sp. RHCl1 TaxID=2995320 RepID=UPI00248B8394|nr:5-formyltetrahydrofolate cyclo-ligase [Thalassomonas sp. RHCl1]